jgi:hypothetical protein
LLTTGLPVARLLTARLLRTGLLAWLAAIGLLPLTTLLSATAVGSRLLAARELLDLTPDTFGLIERLLRRHRAFIVTRLRGSGALRFLQIVAKLIERIGGERLAHYGVLAHALAQRGFGPLHAALYLGLFAAAQRFPHLL